MITPPPDNLDRDSELMATAQLKDLQPHVQISLLLAGIYCKKSCVYFVRFGDFVKIGWSRDCSRRFEDLDIYGEPMEILLVVPGNAAKESEYHDRFSELHIRKEMFRYEGALQQFVEDCRHILLETAQSVL